MHPPANPAPRVPTRMQQAYLCAKIVRLVHLVCWMLLHHPSTAQAALLGTFLGPPRQSPMKHALPAGWARILCLGQVRTVSDNAIGDFLRFADIFLLFDHVLGAGASTVDVCISCNKGKWSDKLAATANSTCIDCLAGIGKKFLWLFMFHMLTRCHNDAGSFSTTPAANSSSTCRVCPAGSFSNITGSSYNSCSPCANGTFASQAGRSACTKCSAGYAMKQAQ
jgi:hypothetical protein